VLGGRIEAPAAGYEDQLGRPGVDKQVRRLRTPHGRAWPLTLSIAEYRRPTGTTKTPQAIRDDPEKGRIPAMPRKARSGEHWRIPTVRLLDDLGVPYEVEAA